MPLKHVIDSCKIDAGTFLLAACPFNVDSTVVPRAQSLPYLGLVSIHQGLKYYRVCHLDWRREVPYIRSLHILTPKQLPVCSPSGTRAAGVQQLTVSGKGPHGLNLTDIHAWYSIGFELFTVLVIVLVSREK